MARAGQPRRGAAVTVFAAVRTVVVVPLFFLLSIVLAAIVVAVAMVRRDAPLIERTVRLWSRLFLAAAPASLEIEGRERVQGSAQYVFVANHLSNFDVPAMILAAPVSVRYLAKKEVYRLPFIGQAMKAIGTIKIDREATGRAHMIINEGVTAARARGHSLVIFPEGTRSSDGRLAPFKKGAFRIAISNDLPVVPVTIQGTWELWPPGSKLFYPGRVKITVHDPIPTADLDLSDISALRDRCHAIVASSLPASLSPPM